MSFFEWNSQKSKSNNVKHGVSFEEAKNVFLDPKRVVIEDAYHSEDEKRWFCLGKVKGKILTVRFTYRNKKIRLIGAGYWRKGKKRYEKENNLQK